MDTNDRLRNTNVTMASEAVGSTREKLALIPKGAGVDRQPYQEVPVDRRRALHELPTGIASSMERADPRLVPSICGFVP